MNDFNEVEVYFSECLLPTLSRLGVSAEFGNQIVENSKMQVYSFCSHWSDLEFRNGLLVVGLEEGMFYEPSSPINPFVVVVI